MLSIFTNPSAQAGYDTRSIFKRSLTGLISGFSFSYTSCITKAEEPSLSYYLPIAGGRIIGFIPFSRVLLLCEMQKSRRGLKLVSPCPFRTTMTITPQLNVINQILLFYSNYSIQHYPFICTKVNDSNCCYVYH